MLLCCVLGIADRRTERCSDWYHEPAAIPCNSLYLYDYPWCWFSLQCYTMADTYTARRMVPSIFKTDNWYRKKRFPLPTRFPLDDPSGILMEFVLNHTKFGRYTIAIGSNKEAAALSGINVKFYHVMVYVVCGLFTGLAAIAYAAVTPTVQPGTGAGLEMDAIGGVFVGGVAASGGYGSVIGTLVGIFRHHASENRSSICRPAGKLAADHHRSCIDRCSSDRYPEREKKCTLICKTGGITSKAILLSEHVNSTKFIRM